MGLKSKSKAGDLPQTDLLNISPDTLSKSNFKLQQLVQLSQDSNIDSKLTTVSVHPIVSHSM